MINLGDKVKDKITGFEGIAIAKVIYLNGCISYEVRAQKLKDVKMLNTVWIDEQQLTNKSRAVVGGIRGKPKRIDSGVKSLVLAIPGEQSREPAVIRNRIVALMGDLSQIELFARPPKVVLFADESYQG